jgi:hypothetical protein
MRICSLAPADDRQCRRVIKLPEQPPGAGATAAPAVLAAFHPHRACCAPTFCLQEKSSRRCCLVKLELNPPSAPPSTGPCSGPEPSAAHEVAPTCIPTSLGPLAARWAALTIRRSRRISTRAPRTACCTWGRRNCPDTRIHNRCSRVSASRRLLRRSRRARRAVLSFTASRSAASRPARTPACGSSSASAARCVRGGRPSARRAARAGWAAAARAVTPPPPSQGPGPATPHMPPAPNFPQVIEARIVYDRDSGRAAGYAYVSYATKAEAGATRQGRAGSLHWAARAPHPPALAPLSAPTHTVGRSSQPNQTPTPGLTRPYWTRPGTWPPLPTPPPPKPQYPQTWRSPRLTARCSSRPAAS